MYKYVDNILAIKQVMFVKSIFYFILKSEFLSMRIQSRRFSSLHEKIFMAEPTIFIVDRATNIDENERIKYWQNL